MITGEQKKLLLKVARSSVTATVLDEPPVTQEEQIKGASYGGAFVTLRNQGQLRGCMGTFDPDPDMVSTVQSVAASSACDPRFVRNPITADELPKLHIEISILAAPEPASDPLSLELGKHGIIIENPQGQGCFLPQVATELGWNKEEFLTNCCRSKAYLRPDAWKDPDTRVLLFTAEVFAEE